MANDLQVNQAINLTNQLISCLEDAERQLSSARNFAGSLRTDCPEGDLEWVPLAKLKDLPHWQADEIFYDFLAENHPFYSLKVIYKDNILQKVYLAGKPYDHWASLPKDATSN